jgi:hypothetical protein
VPLICFKTEAEKAGNERSENNLCFAELNPANSTMPPLCCMRKQPRKQPSEAATASFANLRHLLPFLDNERRVAGQVNRKTRVTVEDCTLRVPESILAQSRTGLV